MNSRNSKLKDLQAVWYKKLKESGFKDIEKSEHALKSSAMKNIAYKYDQARFEVKQDYYRMAGYFLHDYAFESEQERTIWELHCEGVSIRNIAAKLRTNTNKVNKRSVNETLQKLVQKMYRKIVR